VKLVTGNSCSASDTVVQTVTIINASVTSTDESCAGLSDGTATASVAPGSGSYTYSWNTIPVQTDSMATNLPAGSYTVTVSGTNVCSISETIQVLVASTNFTATTAALATSCAGVDDGIAVLQTASPGLYNYSWNTSPVQNTDTAFNLSPGSYTVTVSGPGICAPQLFTVDVIAGNAGTPENFLGGDTSTCTGNAIMLVAGNYSSYFWDDGSDSSFRIVDRPGEYHLEVTTTAGCVGVDSIYVEEKCLDDVVFPNSFTPNDDGMNDIFRAYGTGVASFEMQLYDRWGEKIFQSSSIDDGWNGTYFFHRVHDGIYICVVTYSMDGVNIRTKKGMVALIR